MIEGIWAVVMTHRGLTSCEVIIGVYTTVELAENAVFNYLKLHNIATEPMKINDNNGMRYSDCYTMYFPEGMAFRIENFAINTAIE